MPCKEKELLMGKYGETTATFAEIVVKLQRQMKWLSKPEYDLRLQLAQDAQIKSDEARIVFEHHVREHQC
jgi:hypothetical protein